MFVMDGGIFGHAPETEAAFFEGYGPYEADPTALTYYRYAWALDDLASFAEESLSRTPEGGRGGLHVRGALPPQSHRRVRLPLG